MRIPARRSTAVLVGALAVGLALSTPGIAKAPRKAVVHGANGKKKTASHVPTPKMFDLKHGAGEPTIGIDNKGNVFMTVSSGCVTSCTGSDEMAQTVAPGGRVVYATFDHGKTWKDITPGVHPASPHAISMDPYLYVDNTPDSSRIFDVDLTVACSELSYSDDGGTNWITNPIACGVPVNDHQTVFSGKPVTSPTVRYPKILYYCVNQLATTTCTKSLDGGLSFIPTANVPPMQCSGLNGHGVADSKGNIYLPLGNCGKPYIAISKNEGDSWQIKQVADLGVAGGDPSVAVDAKGNLYYVFVDGDDRLPRLVTSKNGGKTWSKPVMIAPKGVQAANLVTVTVGKPGSIAFAYYGTTEDPEDKQSGWNGYLAEGIGVLGKSPTFYTATVNDPKHPLKVNGCGPGRCGRVLDFIDVEIAPDGTPWAPFVDACEAACEESRVESIHDNDGVVGTLVGGPKLK